MKDFKTVFEKAYINIKAKEDKTKKQGGYRKPPSSPIKECKIGNNINLFV